MCLPCWVEKHAIAPKEPTGRPPRRVRNACAQSSTTGMPRASARATISSIRAGSPKRWVTTTARVRADRAASTVAAVTMPVDGVDVREARDRTLGEDRRERAHVGDRSRHDLVTGLGIQRRDRGVDRRAPRAARDRVQGACQLPRALLELGRLHALGRGEGAGLDHGAEPCQLLRAQRPPGRVLVRGQQQWWSVQVRLPISPPCHHRRRDHVASVLYRRVLRATHRSPRNFDHHPGSTDARSRGRRRLRHPARGGEARPRALGARNGSADGPHRPAPPGGARPAAGRPWSLVALPVDHRARATAGAADRRRRDRPHRDPRRGGAFGRRGPGRHELDPGRCARGLGPRPRGGPRRGGTPQLRPDDARGAQPRGHRPPRGPPLRADGPRPRPPARRGDRRRPHRASRGTPWWTPPAGSSLRPRSAAASSPSSAWNRAGTCWRRSTVRRTSTTPSDLPASSPSWPRSPSPSSSPCTPARSTGPSTPAWCSGAARS